MSDDDRGGLLNKAEGELRRSGDEDLDDDFESDRGKGSGKKKVLFILLPILLLGGGGAGAYFSGILDDLINPPVKAEATVEAKPQNSIYFDLPDMLVNLNSVGPKPSYLKLRASLELAEGTDTLLLSILKPRIIDKFHVYMRELRLNDLRASGGLSRLREELRAEINKAVSPIEVKQVLFRNLLVQ